MTKDNKTAAICTIWGAACGIGLMSGPEGAFAVGIANLLLLGFQLTKRAS